MASINAPRSAIFQFPSMPVPGVSFTPLHSPIAVNAAAGLVNDKVLMRQVLPSGNASSRSVPKRRCLI